MSSWTNFCRQLKNNTLYTVAQAKVRDATSNDVAFPCAEELISISLLTYDPNSFGQVMNVLWKRLNDKSWRHVLKSLNLVEHLLKNGHLKVAEKCRENIFLFCMLQTYQYVEGTSDWGAFIRGQADAIVKLLHDSDLLMKERELAMLERAKGSASAKKTPMKTGGRTYQGTPTLTMAQRQTIAEQIREEQAQPTTDNLKPKEVPSFYAGLNESAPPATDLKSEVPHPEQLKKKNTSPIVNANTTKQDEILDNENQYDLYL